MIVKIMSYGTEDGEPRYYKVKNPILFYMWYRMEYLMFHDNSCVYEEFSEDKYTGDIEDLIPEEELGWSPVMFIKSILYFTRNCKEFKQKYKKDIMLAKKVLKLYQET